MSSETDPIIRIRNLTKDYKTEAETLHILRDVDMDVYAGESVAVMGPSGTGKSTMLYVMGLLQPPTRGEYHVLGRDAFRLSLSEKADFRRRLVGFVLQSNNMFEHSTVYENLEFPLIYSGVGRRKRGEYIERALDRVNLLHRIHHNANRLSGGEQQRVAIARALVNSPRILLADEPTGQLDRDNSRQVMQDFKHFTTKDRNVMILVTHDPDVAKKCTKVLHLTDGKLIPDPNHRQEDF